MLEIPITCEIDGVQASGVVRASATDLSLELTSPYHIRVAGWHIFYLALSHHKYADTDSLTDYGRTTMRQLARGAIQVAQAALARRTQFEAALAQYQVELRRLRRIADDATREFQAIGPEMWPRVERGEIDKRTYKAVHMEPARERKDLAQLAVDDRELAFDQATRALLGIEDSAPFCFSADAVVKFLSEDP